MKAEAKQILHNHLHQAIQDVILTNDLQPEKLLNSLRVVESKK